jgi:hypothetical protein
MAVPIWTNERHLRCLLNGECPLGMGTLGSLRHQTI